ncbi:alpha/beta fold hydrolase [Mycobacterium heckeshornense]
MIGWSLGGIVARMIARNHPEKVRHVFTLGSPFRMLATDTLGPRLPWRRFLKAQSEELDLLYVHEHDRPPLASTRYLDLQPDRRGGGLVDQPR